MSPIDIKASGKVNLMQRALEFESEITIKYRGKSASLGDVNQLEALDLRSGYPITFTAEGSDAAAAVDYFRNLIMTTRVNALR